MAVLGFQLVISLIGACILSKVVSYFTFVRCIYGGLRRYIVPSDLQLLETYGNSKLKSRIKKRLMDTASGGNCSGTSQDVFHFPRTLSIQLQSTRVTQSDVATLPLYSAFQWLLDFSTCAVGIYAITEVTYNVVLPWMYPGHATTRMRGAGLLSFSTQFNLSLVWLALSAWFSLTTLFSITGLYFRSSADTSGSVTTLGAKKSPNREWFLIFSAAFFHWILSTFMLSLEGRYFDFGFQNAYNNLTLLNTTLNSTAAFVTHGLLHTLLSVACAFLGALFIYPGMKFGKIYVDAIRKSDILPHKRMLFHLTFIAPIFPILLWIEPLTDHLSRSLIKLSSNPTIVSYPTVQLLLSFSSSLFSEHLQTVRLLASITVVLLRLAITRCILQVYLYSAQDKLDQFSREPGRSSNKEVQRIVASIFYCLNLVSLQWLSPTLLLLVLVCLYKNSTGMTWIPGSAYGTEHTVSESLTPPAYFSSASADSWLGMLAQTRMAFVKSSNILGLRGAVISQTVLSFFSWWCLVTMQTVSMLGLAYHRFVSD